MADWLGLQSSRNSEVAGSSPALSKKPELFLGRT